MSLVVSILNAFLGPSFETSRVSNSYIHCSYDHFSKKYECGSHYSESEGERMCLHPMARAASLEKISLLPPWK